MIRVPAVIVSSVDVVARFQETGHDCVDATRYLHIKLELSQWGWELKVTEWRWWGMTSRVTMIPVTHCPMCGEALYQNL